LPVSSSNREALPGAVNAMASGSRRRVTVWTGARATTVRETPDAEGSSIDRAPAR